MKILDVPLTGVLTTLLSTSVAGLNLMPSSALAASSNSVQDIVDRAYEAIELQNETSAFGIAFDKPQSMEGGLLESTPNENTYEYQAEWGQITLTFGKADYYGSDDVLFYNDSNFPVDYFTQTNAADGYSYLGYLRYEDEPMSFNVHFMLNGSLIEAWTVLASPSPVVMSVICPVNELELALLAIDELYSSVRPAASSIMPDRTSDESNSRVTIFGNWAIKYYIDEYGLPTSTGYLDLAGEGSYSRLSLSNEDLTARFIIDDENASVALHTDGTRIIGTQDETYQVSITSNKEEDPVHYEMEAHLAEDGDRFYFSDYETIIYLLATGDTLDFCLENSRQSEE